MKNFYVLIEKGILVYISLTNTFYLNFSRIFYIFYFISYQKENIKIAKENKAKVNQSFV